jgi:Acyl-CoA carboxylase epsilon subunit
VKTVAGGQSLEAPVITVTRGRATPGEIAAIVAVLLAAAQATNVAAQPPAPRSAWAQAGRMRDALPHSWRASGLPR